MSLRRPFLVIVTLALFAAIVFIARYGSRHGPHLDRIDDWIHVKVGQNSSEKESECTENLEWLEHYQFTYPIQYVSRDIFTKPAPNGERPSLSVIDEPLFGDFSPVDLKQSQKITYEKCAPPLTLEVPRGKVQHPDASNMIFALQTTMTRLKDTVKHLERWLPHTNARLYAMVIDEAEGQFGLEEVVAKYAEMRALEKEFRLRGMNTTLIRPVHEEDSFPQRYFSLVNVMYEHVDDLTEWLVVIDDDTFFPSLFDLLEMLSPYDYTEEQYLGSLSEDWWAVNQYGYMGFGGAGVFLSVPMAKMINDHADECRENLRTSAGDISIMECIYRFSETKLTPIPTLHQVDMQGDLAGFYESGRQMLSLHHWKEGSMVGYKLDIEKMHLVANICDSCFLQRWLFPNELVLTNGFSIVQYPEESIAGYKVGENLGSGIGNGDLTLNLDEMEETWNGKINVRHSLAPTRERIPDEFKVSYKLLDSVIVDCGRQCSGKQGEVVRQLYFKKENDGVNATVMVLNWHLGPRFEDEEMEIGPLAST